MKVQLELTIPDAKGEILELKEDFQDKNFSGVKYKNVKQKQVEGTMSGTELLPILELVLSPAVSIAVITGIFKVVKDFVELKKHIITTKSEQQKVILTKTNKNGEIQKLNMSLFNEEERKKFLEFFQS